MRLWVNAHNNTKNVGEAVAAKRKGLSKKTRFDVFKRDAFKCQYCGAHPPSVLLEVDHIIAVASGGTNQLDNLITSCQPCNAGKGARSLESIPESLDVRASVLKEREAQIAGYQELLRCKAERLSNEAESVVQVYEKFNPGYTLNERGRASVVSFIDQLGMYEVVAAMTTACLAPHVRDADRFRYFCGICWRRIRGD